MTYKRFNYPNEQTVTLQGIGHILGRPSSEIKAGDTLMWNFGSKSEVLSVADSSKHFVTIKTSGGYRKLKKTRLVVILNKD